MKIPSHIAIIMDGNGRWAKMRKLPRNAGHKKGVQALKKTVKAASKLNVPCLTVYAFSTENWKRPENEINFLFQLFTETLKNEGCELSENNVKIKIIGQRRGLPDFLTQEIKNIEEKTANNNGLQLNIAFNYGGKAEIIDIIKQINNNGKINELSEKLIDDYLYIRDYPEVELLIRTGGEKRLSNFLLWESAYAELYFCDKFWPDFDKKDLIAAIKEFTDRERRFGGLDDNAF